VLEQVIISLCVHVCELIEVNVDYSNFNITLITITKIDFT